MKKVRMVMEVLGALTVVVAIAIMWAGPSAKADSAGNDPVGEMREEVRARAQIGTDLKRREVRALESIASSLKKMERTCRK